MPSPDSAVRRVLIVDDDPLVRELLAAVLSDDRFELDFAADGDQALVAASASPPDMVILDVMMPGMDGYEVCRILRASHPETHIVMLTARAGDGEEAMAKASGADAFMTKPFSPLILRELMERAQR